MSPRDWFEVGWHAGLLAFAWPGTLSYLGRRRWARLALATTVLAALAYHVAIVQACHAEGPLCYWGNP